MNQKLIPLILYIVPIIIEGSHSPAEDSMKECTDALNAAQNASERLAAIALDDPRRAALSFAMDERTGTAAKALDVVKNAVNSMETRKLEIARTAAAELTAILDDELTALSHTTPPTLVHGEILQEFSKLESIATSVDGGAAILAVLDIIKAAIRRAA